MGKEFAMFYFHSSKFFLIKLSNKITQAKMTASK